VLGQAKTWSARLRVEAAIRAIEDLERLERMGEAVIDASNWQQVLATP
jgi:hypothetical protein